MSGQAQATILVVEDHAAARRFITNLLSRSFFSLGGGRWRRGLACHTGSPGPGGLGDYRSDDAQGWADSIWRWSWDALSQHQNAIYVRLPRQHRARAHRLAFAGYGSVQAIYGEPPGCSGGWPQCSASRFAFQNTIDTVSQMSGKRSKLWIWRVS